MSQQVKQGLFEDSCTYSTRGKNFKGKHSVHQNHLLWIYSLQVKHNITNPSMLSQISPEILTIQELACHGDILSLTIKCSRVFFASGAFCQLTDCNISLSIPAVSLQGVLKRMSCSWQMRADQGFELITDTGMDELLWKWQNRLLNSFLHLLICST